MKRNPRYRRRPASRAARLALCGVLAAGAVGAGSAPAGANPPDTTVSVNLGQAGKAATHAGAGFLYGLTQDGSGPADNLLQPLQPTLFRGGGAGISGNGWIGDNYTAGPGQVALHAVRDVDQAIMTVSVDGGTAQTVDNYASSRNASGVVWTSTVLAAGSHTITIVNTGNRNAASSGINIAIDRADITG
jgi:hypothetical protein